MRHGFRLALFVVVIFLPFFALCGAAGWLVGRGFTLADMTLMPAINNLSRHLGHDQLLRQFPAIGLWFAKHSQRRSWQAVCAETVNGANA